MIPTYFDSFLPDPLFHFFSFSKFRSSALILTLLLPPSPKGFLCHDTITNDTTTYEERRVLCVCVFFFPFEFAATSSNHLTLFLPPSPKGFFCCNPITCTIPVKKAGLCYFSKVFSRWGFIKSVFIRSKDYNVIFV